LLVCPPPFILETPYTFTNFSKPAHLRLANGPTRSSTLNLIDLAGSESAKLTNATGGRQKEGQYINKSLLALGEQSVPRFVPHSCTKGTGSDSYQLDDMVM